MSHPLRCDDFAPALVEESTPPGLQAHLEQCEDCRALARLHASARKLRLAEPPLPAAFTSEAIAQVVRQRRQRRRWAASGAAACAVALFAVVLSGREPVTPVLGDTSAPASGIPVEGQALQVKASPAPATAQAPRLQDLSSEVAGYTRTHPGVEDTAYEAFGLLALWVSPPESTALDAEPFRTALAVFQPWRPQ